jgi:anaerobic ribonucleoside-triphosphate reductase activating protein
MEEIRFCNQQVVWQEVPNETSLAFFITGCPLGCKGCHSVESWKRGSGQILTEIYLAEQLQKYQDLISCVLFMGGEWLPEKLILLLKIAQAEGLATCLYTGLEKTELDPRILTSLTYLKTGRWIAERGGLNSLTTNQRFVDLRTGECLNSLFVR